MLSPTAILAEGLISRPAMLALTLLACGFAFTPLLTRREIASPGFPVFSAAPVRAQASPAEFRQRQGTRRFTQPPAWQSWPPWACLACLLAVSGRDVVAKVFAKDSRPIVLYDGVCNLCNGGVNFALDADRSGRLRFAALQSRRAAAG